MRSALHAMEKILHQEKETSFVCVCVCIHACVCCVCVHVSANFCVWALFESVCVFVCAFVWIVCVFIVAGGGGVKLKTIGFQKMSVFEGRNPELFSCSESTVFLESNPLSPQQSPFTLNTHTVQVRFSLTVIGRSQMTTHGHGHAHRRTVSSHGSVSMGTAARCALCFLSHAKMNERFLLSRSDFTLPAHE